MEADNLFGEWKQINIQTYIKYWCSNTKNRGKTLCFYRKRELPMPLRGSILP